MQSECCWGREIQQSHGCDGAHVSATQARPLWPIFEPRHSEWSALTFGAGRWLSAVLAHPRRVLMFTFAPEFVRLSRTAGLHPDWLSFLSSVQIIGSVKCGILLAAKVAQSAVPPGSLLPHSVVDVVLAGAAI